MSPECQCVTGLAKDRCPHYRAYQCCRAEDVAKKPPPPAPPACRPCLSILPLLPLSKPIK